MQALLEKLQLKDSYSGQLINVPASLKKDFTRWPRKMLSKKTSGLDYVLVFVKDAAEIRKYARKLRLVRADGLVLFAYPKKSSGMETDIRRGPIPYRCAVVYGFVQQPGVDQLVQGPGDHVLDDQPAAMAMRWVLRSMA